MQSASASAKILDINYNHFYHTVKSQVLAGAGNYFRPSKPHSGTLCRTLYQIGGLAAHRGEKRKNSGVITIQAASKTRRLHRHRGSGPATSGRKVKDWPSHSRAISEDIDDEDITFAHVRHSLPSQKEKKENKNSL